MSKHEKVPCERCNTSIECKSNSFTRCDCAQIFLTHHQIEWISDQYEGCLCVSCLLQLRQAFDDQKQ